MQYASAIGDESLPDKRSHSAAARFLPVSARNILMAVASVARWFVLEGAVLVALYLASVDLEMFRYAGF